MNEEIQLFSINFIKTGECKRCGACEKPSCPHLTWEDGLATCKVYGEKEYFELNCHVFPDSPFCDVLLDEICGFKFVPVAEDDVRKYEKLLKEVKKNRAKILGK